MFQALSVQCKALVLSPVKQSTLVGVLAVLYGLVAHFYNFNFAPSLLIGYEFLALPGMFLLTFFSEETPLKPKLLLFLLGQFNGYFLFFFILTHFKQRLSRLKVKTKKRENKNESYHL